MNDFLQLEGKHILVTGATSGIGRQTAVSLSEYGARVTLIARREEKLQETLSLMKGEGHLPVCFEMAEIEGIAAMVKGVVEKMGLLDGYVQCAGTNKDMPISLVKPEKLQAMMQTNFFSFFEMVRAISKKGMYNPGLSIVGTASTASKCGVPSQTAYSATKAAMNGAMRPMAIELAPKGIRVNTILPGPTDTEMYRDYLAMRGEVAGESKPRTARNYLGMNKPADVANAILFLLSPASGQITGIELPVDAGYTSC